jgi:hypothetical protein
MADTTSDPAPERAPGDKREHPRFQVEGATTCLGKPGFLSSLGFGPIRHQVVNLSEGGAMVRVGKNLPVDSRHELLIEIPTYRETLETVGEVRWCAQSAKNKSDFYVGIRFVDLPAEEQRKLAGIYAKATRKDPSSVNLKPPGA